MAQVHLRGVKKTYDNKVEVIHGIGMEIADGEFIVIVGPSGCGKSTLLNMGSGLYLPSEGEVFVDGEPVTGPNRHVAFMLQKDLLLPWRTVTENVMLGVEIQGVAAAERQNKHPSRRGKLRLRSRRPSPNPVNRRVRNVAAGGRTRNDEKARQDRAFSICRGRLQGRP
mgnify:CR=1 FL=1